MVKEWHFFYTVILYCGETLVKPLVKELLKEGNRWSEKVMKEWGKKVKMCKKSGKESKESIERLYE